MAGLVLIILSLGLGSHLALKPLLLGNRTAAGPTPSPSARTRPFLAVGSQIAPWTPIRADASCGGGVIDNEPAVAQSTDDRKIFAAIAQQCAPNGNRPPVPAVFVTHDGGQNWTTYPVQITYNMAGDVGIVWDPAHHVFVISFLDFTKPPTAASAGPPSSGVMIDGRVAIQAFQSTQNGETFSNQITIYQDRTLNLEKKALTPPQTFPYLTDADRPFITVNSFVGSRNYGEVVVTYDVANFNHQGTEQSRDLVISHTGAKATGAASDPTDPRQAADWVVPPVDAIYHHGINSTKIGRGGQPAFASAGDLMVAWEAFPPGTTVGTRTGLIKTRLSQNGGNSWPTPEHTVTRYHDLQPGGMSCPFALVNLATRCDSRPYLAGYPKVTSDSGEDSAFVLVWADYGSNNTLATIRGRITEDDGGSWNKAAGKGQFDGTEFTIDDGDLGGRAGATGAKFNPSIAIAPSGRIDIGYMDTENTISGNPPYGNGYQYFMVEASSLQNLTAGRLDPPVAIDQSVSNPQAGDFVGDYTTVSSTSSDTAAVYTAVDTAHSTHTVFIRICYPTC